ncbi:MAG: BolA family transcriptional regulator [Hyphomicrobiales bacterium]|nr:MAG: BolA family transcriptional regulator [Hyphomicrobiales bacterium]
MSMRDLIEAKLKLALQPESLEVVDESEQHAGHLPRHGHADQGGDTHFRVFVVSSMFEGKSRVDRHRMVNDLLGEEMAGTLHALAIHATAPGEPTRRR